MYTNFHEIVSNKLSPPLAEKLNTACTDIWTSGNHLKSEIVDMLCALIYGDEKLKTTVILNINRRYPKDFTVISAVTQAYLEKHKLGLSNRSSEGDNKADDEE